MNLKFDDDFKLYENIYITTDYTLKIFQKKKLLHLIIYILI